MSRSLTSITKLHAYLYVPHGCTEQSSSVRCCSPHDSVPAPAPPHIGLPGRGRPGDGEELLEEELHAEVVHGRAEEQRRLLALHHL